jgi:hypothetical protein
MNSDIALNFLVELFRSHGIQSSIDEDWVLPESSPHAIRAHWHPGDTTGRLDVHVLVGDELVIEECFAGIGAGALGLNDALANFTINSFHVLLATFWNLNDASQVTTESWSISGVSYTAHIGNCGTRASEGVEPFIPQSLFPAIAQAIQAENLHGELHWFRFFFCNVAGEYTVESLRDNEEWNRGKELLHEIPWEPSPGYYSVRLFLALRKVQSAPAKRISPFDRARDIIFKGWGNRPISA